MNDKRKQDNINEVDELCQVFRLTVVALYSKKPLAADSAWVREATIMDAFGKRYRFHGEGADGQAAMKDLLLKVRARFEELPF